MLNKLKENIFIIIVWIVGLGILIGAIAIPVTYLAKKDALHCFFDTNMMVCVELNEINKKGQNK